jgi:hypothetical protein
MADEIKEEVVAEPVVEITDELAIQQANEAIEAEMVERVEKIINPPKEEIKEEVKAEEVKVNEVKEEVIATTKEEVVDDSTPKVEDLKLPNRLMQAAKRSHITDAEVLKLGDNAELVLGKMADSLDAYSERLGELGKVAKVKAVKETPKEEKLSTLDLPEDFDLEAAKQIKGSFDALLDKVSRLETSLREKEQQAMETQLVARDQQIDGKFDAIAKEYPEFGNSKSLTNAELVMRKNVWEKADDILAGATLNREKISLEEALDQAMSIYEAKNPNKVKEKLLNDVKEREKQHIARPASKKQAALQSKGKDQAVRLIDDYLNRGRDGWDR